MEPKFLIFEDITPVTKPAPDVDLSHRKRNHGNYVTKPDIKTRRKTLVILRKMKKFCIQELEKEHLRVSYIKLLNKTVSIIDRAFACLLKFSKIYNIRISWFFPILSEAQIKALDTYKIRTLIKLYSFQKQKLFEILVSERDRTIPSFLIIAGRGRIYNRKMR